MEMPEQGQPLFGFYSIHGTNTKQFGCSLVAALIGCLDYDPSIAVLPSMQGNSMGFQKSVKISVR